MTSYPERSDVRRRGKNACGDPRYDEWIAKLGDIPDEARRFDVTPAAALAQYGLGPNILGDLVERGLPHEPAVREARFDHSDLHFIGVRLGVARTHLTAMKLWARTLVNLSRYTHATLRVAYFPYTAGGPGQLGTFLIGPGKTVARPIRPQTVAVSFDVTIHSPWPDPDERSHAVLQSISQFDFCLIPPALRSDMTFARTARLLDCATASLLVTEECRRRDLEARTAFGLLLSMPYATPHYWAEILSRGRWVPVDPLLLQALASFAGLNRADWPPTRSPGVALLRLADSATAIASIDGAPVPATFLTKLVSG